MGVDVGGTKVEAAVLDASGAIIARRRIATPQSRYEAALVAISDLVLSVEKRSARAARSASASRARSRPRPGS